LVRAWDFQHAIEHFEAQALKNRAREENPGEHTKIYDEIRTNIWEADTIKELKKVRREGQQAMDGIALRTDFEPLKVGIVGEIYVVLDPFANLELEKKLGDMGVQVHRSIWLSHWIQRELILNKLPITKILARRSLRENAKPYLNEFVGGDGIESIANMRVYKKMQYDGVIEIGPFTCIPEIVAKSILPAMSRDLDLPVLTFNVDEHTGEAGVLTRLEAFSDLLSQRRDGIPLPSRKMSALVDEEVPSGA
jgi:predicted nucleotide-binding protein (sugar kinase/HSP70/actin superfamily)